MVFDPDERPRPKTGVAIEPIPLDPLSIEDLQARISSAEAEIARCAEAIAKKKASRDAAAAFFKS
ncbi:DUF1192 domain-containing protein [Zavarzinia aquatilis]|uniref:DUF1192 domain-containing protein n=1 Tax=Zavarzinia aquatilis TaxID=2211142 RepID=A0A317EFK4_9PROT|nr:DUF1192 domain-containing protein [Zavarzinia aquatilis]PWR25074.1 DUF1192 domain-containing protein [Zavarzinia aquatilis]